MWTSLRCQNGHLRKWPHKRRVCVAVLLALTELAEMPCLCCNTRHRFHALCESVLLSCAEFELLSCSNSLSWPSRSRCCVSSEDLL